MISVVIFILVKAIVVVRNGNEVVIILKDVLTIVVSVILLHKNSKDDVIITLGNEKSWHDVTDVGIEGKDGDEDIKLLIERKDVEAVYCVVLNERFIVKVVIFVIKIIIV